MADFEPAIDTVIDLHEKGYVSPEKAARIGDTGGATIDGISLRYLQDHGIDIDGDGDVDEQDILALVGKRERIEDLYLAGFWAPLDQVADQDVATKILDARVNMGIGPADRLAQQSANSLGHSLVEDGRLGPKSLEAINACDPQTWMRAMCQVMAERYRDIARRKPVLGKHCLANWLDRARWPFREAV